MLIVFVMVCKYWWLIIFECFVVAGKVGICYEISVGIEGVIDGIDVDVVIIIIIVYVLVVYFVIEVGYYDLVENLMMYCWVLDGVEMFDVLV